MKSGDTALVVLEPGKPVCVEVFSKCPPLGRFTIADLKTIVAAGVIRSVESYVDTTLDFFANIINIHYEMFRNSCN